MTPQFSIAPTWEAIAHDPKEIGWTSAFLRITLNDRVLTRAEDDWSKSVRDEVMLSAYPLALWFAASWWRLIWEPAPSTTSLNRNVSWRMAHEMTAAGHGFVWPHVAFESDGETIEIICQPSEPRVTEPVRYLSNFRAAVSIASFEAAVDTFVNLVLARLEAVGEPDTELKTVWREVGEERADPEANMYRQLEAQLGFEPDEAPDELMKGLLSLSSEAGNAACEEIAPACSGDDPGQRFDQVIELAKSTGVEGSLPPLLPVPNISALQRSQPWERGRELAHLARQSWQFQADMVPDATLSELLSIKASVFEPQGVEHSNLPLGLAIRDGAADHVKFLFRKRNRHGRRFEAARFLAESLIAPATDRWLPTTDSKTARQKVQRAFATEFLCPINELREYLGGDFSNEAIEEAGEHFVVSPLAVESHLRNNELLPWSAMP